MRGRPAILLTLVALAIPTLAGAGVLGELEEEIRSLAARAGPAVVQVTAERDFHPDLPEDLDPEFRKRLARALLGASSTVGTGFLVSEDGLVITAERIVAGALRVQVTFSDGHARPGEVLGSDSFFGVALIRVDPPEGVAPLELSENAETSVGSLGVFVGHTFGIAPNLSLGIVSGVGRCTGLDAYDNYVVMNAPILPGDAGGPFLGPRGRVLGMGVECYSGGVMQLFNGENGFGIRGLSGAAGVGLVVPAADLRFAIREIEEYGRVRSGRLGVRISTGSLDVREVVPESPAAACGLRPGDRICCFGDRPIGSFGQFRFALRRLPVGEPVAIRVLREGEEITLDAALEERRPEFLLAADLPSLARNEAGEWSVPDEAGWVAEGLRIGLRPGDVILTVNGKPFESMPEFHEHLRWPVPDGRGIRLRIRRNGEEILIAHHR